MTAQDRARHERNQERQNPALPSEGRASAVSGHTGVWLIRGTPLKQLAVVWIKRPMPADQWPPDQRAPRDNSFAWWIRAHCGHQGGAKQMAFYEEADADMYEQVFRADPCRWTHCPESMIQNDRRMSRG